MKCKNCGADIIDTAKFCEYCGSRVELENQSTDNLESTVVENESLESANSIGVTDDVDLDKTIVVEPIKNESMVSNETIESSSTNQLNNQENQVSNVGPMVGNTDQSQMSSNTSSTQNLVSNKEKNNKMFLIIGGVVLAVIAIALVLFAYTKSSNSSIEVLKTAIANLSEKGENSATVDVGFSLEASTGESFSLSATVKAERKNNDQMDMLIKLNKSLLFDEINIYASTNQKEATMYLESTLIDMLGTTESLNPIWVYYTTALDEIIGEENIENIDLQSVIDKKHFVYIEETNGIKRYQLIIDQELIDSMKAKLEVITDEEMEETLNSIEELDKPIKIDFYINKSNELSKIELDMSEHLVGTEELSSFIISMEFSGLNSTKVEIPSDAINSITDLDTYMTLYAIDDYDFDYDFGYDDMNTGFDDLEFGF